MEEIGRDGNCQLLAKSIVSVRQAAKLIGVNLTKRKASQSIPFIGGAVGAALNASFINDIAWAARRSYQRRWLEDNKVIEPEASVDE